jgi:tetratricopeptide (TPR) repeat protein
MDRLKRDSIPFPTGAIYFTEFLTRHDYDAAERLARATADTARPRLRVNAQEGIVNLLLLRGRLREAERMYPQWVEARLRVRGDTVSPYRIGFFRAMVDGDLRGNTARGIATLDSTLRAHPVGSEPLERDQSMFLAYGYSALGDGAKAEALMNQFVARLDSVGRRRRYVWLTRTRGAIASLEGKHDSAVAYARQGDFEADGLPTFDGGTVWTPLFIGQAFDKAGQADSARKYLTEYIDMAGNGHWEADFINVPRTLFRLGQLYQDAGDRAKAMDYYGRFVELWKAADPELQPRVTEARKAMAELMPDRSK